ncbi:hypothetical protein GGR22_002993 [Flavobacterium gossypii]|uniref:Uncharacterized protein n=1 Tax=Flavobacterium gossypii TaxID=1646119 RepID=A0ABR6DT02_9FLAO|nr:hypothetical protein [Flavobacterium gossypii]MBA9074820.1 hypothetical protein [Flavobacterium gossypii]
MKPQDLIDGILLEFYKKYNVRHKTQSNQLLNLSRYFNFRLKLIEIKPRKVHVAKECITKIFLSEHKNDILLLIDKIKKGFDINPYQSKQSFNVDYHDMMFNDWGIHHLHLNHNKEKAKDYFNKRTGDLLIIKFDKDNAYVITIKHHHDKNVWSDTDTIRSIRDNWNYLLKPFEVGNGNWNPKLKDSEIAIMRNKGYTFPINVDDKTYLMLGHGYASSGDNIAAGTLAGNVYRWIGENLELFNKDKEYFKVLLKKKMHL